MKNNSRKMTPRERRRKARKWAKAKAIILFLCLIVFTGAVIGLAITGIREIIADKKGQNDDAGESVPEVVTLDLGPYPEPAPVRDIRDAEILPEYADLYAQNSDMIGWLSIEDTVIDYPVMQTMWDEDYYLHLGFDKEYNEEGCLLMDTDSVVGSGTAACSYADGTAPSSNLIIHGHTMRNGNMFGDLHLYTDEGYGREHNIICFDSLYEHRRYELIAVFYSQVFYKNQDVFKYYNFFQADTQEEFDDWYSHIKTMSIYDTGVTAVLGDEFITLSCCAYHIEHGRFVVVGKRVE